MTNDKGMTKSETARHDFDEVFWNDPAELTVRERPSAARIYDLEERTARFGEAVIDFAKSIPQNAVTNRIISQLVGAGTSIGANYVEADDAVSKREFPDGSSLCAGAKVASAQTLDGSQRTASDLLENWRSGKNE